MHTVEFCGSNQNVAGTHILTCWLRVMDGVRRVDRCRGPLKILNREGTDYEPTIPVLEEVSTQIGLPETQMRRIDHRVSLQIDRNMLITCGNIRCPLFGEDILGRLDGPLRCASCRAVSRSYYQMTMART